MPQIKTHDSPHLGVPHDYCTLAQLASLPNFRVTVLELAERWYMVFAVSTRFDGITGKPTEREYVVRPVNRHATRRFASIDSAASSLAGAGIRSFRVSLCTDDQED